MQTANINPQEEKKSIERSPAPSTPVRNTTPPQVKQPTPHKTPAHSRVRSEKQTPIAPEPSKPTEPCTTRSGRPVHPPSSRKDYQ